MVSTILKYKDDVSGKLFDILEDAESSEFRGEHINKAFAFYTPIKDENCRFANGGLCIQRTEKFYNRLLDTLIEMINIHEHWIAEEFKKEGHQLSRDEVKGYSWVGRYLSDGNSDLYHWWQIQGNICPVCFREYGQMHYALHCKHDDSIQFGV